MFPGNSGFRKGSVVRGAYTARECWGCFAPTSQTTGSVGHRVEVYGVEDAIAPTLRTSSLSFHQQMWLALTPQDEKEQFRPAQEGDHLITPVQCDLCLCQNMQEHNLVQQHPKEDLFMCFFMLSCTRLTLEEGIPDGSSHALSITIDSGTASIGGGGT
jgi:hypothetical protein